MAKLAFILILVMSVAVLKENFKLSKSEPFIIACASKPEESKTCIMVDKVFTCSSRKYKENIRNDIFKNCLEYKVPAKEIENSVQVFTNLLTQIVY